MSTSGAAPAPILTDAELKLLQALIYQECGMHFDERRTHFLQDRLLRRLRECRADSFYTYYRLLISPEGKQELIRLLENLTVNETSFFRHKAQLDLFQKHVLEDVFRQKSARRDYSVRIWSAGCSTGQEPYTLAMLVTDALAYYYLRNPLPVDLPLPKPLVPPPWRVEILASDINYSVLRAGQEGTYSETQMAMVDYAYRLRYFDKVGESYAIKKALKEIVHFDFHNLKTEYLPQRNDAAAAQRRDFLQERDDVLRRSRAEAAGREVLPLLEHSRPSVRGTCREPAGTDSKVPDGAQGQRNRLPAG